jgi:hypothetical protein
MLPPDVKEAVTTKLSLPTSVPGSAGVFMEEEARASTLTLFLLFRSWPPAESNGIKQIVQPILAAHKDERIVSSEMLIAVAADARVAQFHERNRTERACYPSHLNMRNLEANWLKGARLPEWAPD